MIHIKKKYFKLLKKKSSSQSQITSMNVDGHLMYAAS